MANFTAICDGSFVGHAVASEFDPSVFMALNITDSLLACKGFNGPDILSRHLFLYHTKKLEVGETTKVIYDYLLNNYVKSRKPDLTSLTSQDFFFDQARIDEAVRLADTKLDGRTAGCGPAQRSFPLALCNYISDEDLYQVTLQEAKLTHYNPIAGQVAGITNLIVRHLIRNPDWPNAIANAFTTANLHADVTQINFGYHRRPNLPGNHQAAYAPAVLNAALHYVTKTSNAGEAIATAHANDKFFCSAIVGVLSGARWGIEQDLYKNMIKDNNLQLLRTAANNLASIWKAKPSDING